MIHFDTKPNNGEFSNFQLNDNISTTVESNEKNHINGTF